MSEKQAKMLETQREFRDLNLPQGLYHGTEDGLLSSVYTVELNTCSAIIDCRIEHVLCAIIASFIPGYRLCSENFCLIIIMDIIAFS